MDNGKKQETDLAYRVILGVFCALILFWLTVKVVIKEKAQAEAREAQKRYRMEWGARRYWQNRALKVPPYRMEWRAYGPYDSNYSGSLTVRPLGD